MSVRRSTLRRACFALLMTLCVGCQKTPPDLPVTPPALPAGSVRDTDLEATTSGQPLVTPTRNPPPHPTPSGSPDPAGVAASPAGTATETPTTDMGEIVYLTHLDEGFWRIDAVDGAGKALLYEDSLLKAWAEASPSRRWIAYVAYRPGNVDVASLWVLDVERKRARQVSDETPAGDHGWLVRDRLYYTEYPNAVFDPTGETPPEWGTDQKAFIYDPATQTRTQLPALGIGGSRDQVFYSFSPVEDRAAVVAGARPSLLLMSLDGTVVKTLIEDYSLLNMPVWSPDGTRLAYAYDAYRRALRVFHVRSRRVEQVTRWSQDRSIGDIGWSPDGERIAFNERARPCVVDIRAGIETCFEIRWMADVLHPPMWSPDSLSFLISARASLGDSLDLYRISVLDGKITRLTDSRESEDYYVWR